MSTYQMTDWQHISSILMWSAHAQLERSIILMTAYAEEAEAAHRDKNYIHETVATELYNERRDLSIEDCKVLGQYWDLRAQ